MEILMEGLEVDYIVKVPFRTPICYLRDGVVFTQDEFLLNKDKVKKAYKDWEGKNKEKRK